MTASRWFVSTLLVVAACADEPPSTGSTGSALTKVGLVTPGPIIVKTTRAITAGDQVDLGGVALTAVRRLRTGSWLMQVDDGSLPTGGPMGAAQVDLGAAVDVADAVAGDADVEWAYPDYPVTFFAVPNDPLYAQQQWHFEAIRLPQAWDLTTGNGVRVAVLDTGRVEHSELPWAPGWDAVDLDTDPTDQGIPYGDNQTFWWHHGTHVAGLIAARSNNGVGTAGVCWNCTLIPVRINVDAVAVEEGLDWASHAQDADPVRHPEVGGGAKVINMSFGFLGPSDSPLTCNQVPGVRDAIATAVGRGTVVIEAAGNYARGVEATGDCPGVIAVGATQPSGAIASYSDRGAFVDVMAPGGGGNRGDTRPGFSMYGPGFDCSDPSDSSVYGGYGGAQGAVSTWAVSRPTSELATNPHSFCWRNLSGTSMAAPHVAGVVALMLSVRPELTPAQVEQILELSATLDPARISCPAGDCGWGLIDAERAVRYAQNGGVPFATMSPVGFGDVPVNGAGPATGTLSSIGYGPLVLGPQPALTIEGGGGQIEFAFADGGGCGSGVSCARTFAAIAPGDHLAVPMRCRPTAGGPLQATLVIKSNVTTDTTRVALTCNGVAPDIAVSPMSLAFGSVQIDTTSAEKVVTVSNTGPVGTTLSLSAARSSAELGLTCTGVGCGTCANGTCGATVTGGAAIQLHVTFTPAAIGNRSASISISSNDPDENPTAIGVTASGTAPPPHLTLATGNLELGDVTLGGYAWGPITIGNSTASQGSVLHFQATQGSSQFRLSCVSGCTCDGDGLCSGAVSATAATLWVEFRPTAIGAATSNVSITTDDPAAALTTLVSHGRGISPVSVIDPPGGILYLITPIGHTSTARAITIRNDTTQTIHVGDFHFEGLYAWAFGVASGFVAPQTLAPGATTSWTVVCTPTWFGDQVATFRIEHDAPTPHSFVGVTVHCQSQYADEVEPPHIWPPPPPPPPAL